jgi:hypothetical protein
MDLLPAAAAPSFADAADRRPNRCTAERLARAKPAYTTRFVSRLLADGADGFGLLAGDDVAPQPGDVVLAAVEMIGQHTRIERPDGRRATLFVGDEILVAYGNRYAPDQFEAEVPPDLGETQLVAAGGVAGRVMSSHAAMKPATHLRPIGLLTDRGGVVSLARCAPFCISSAQPPPVAGHPDPADPWIIAVLGTSMNSGKTTVVASIARALAARGLRVAAGKVTGTGAGGDPHLFADAGATTVLDFTDFGFPSTYRLGHTIVRDLFTSLVGELRATGPDVIVLEVADGLFQQETAKLVADPVFQDAVHRVVFAATDALGAVGGTTMLTGLGLAPTVVSGLVTASPLATCEAQAALSVPVVPTAALAACADALLSDELRVLSSGVPAGVRAAS